MSKAYPSGGERLKCQHENFLTFNTHLGRIERQLAVWSKRKEKTAFASRADHFSFSSGGKNAGIEISSRYVCV
jgi:hypothetical protein